MLVTVALQNFTTEEVVIFRLETSAEAAVYAKKAEGRIKWCSSRDEFFNVIMLCGRGIASNQRLLNLKSFAEEVRIYVFMYLFSYVGV